MSENLKLAKWLRARLAKWLPCDGPQRVQLWALVRELEQGVS